MLADFVQETSSAPGTATTINLAGPPAGRRGFLAYFSSGSLVYYYMDDGSQAEWGYGVATAGSPNTLARTVVIGNTAGTTSRLNFTATTRVYCALPADRLAPQRNAARTTAASASAVAFSLDTTEFTVFELVYWNVTVNTAGAQLGLRCGSAGTAGAFDSGASDYNNTLLYSQLPSTSAVGNANGSYVDIGGSALSGANAHRGRQLITPGSAGTQFFVGGLSWVTGSAPELRAGLVNGGRVSNGAKNAIQIFASTGTISGEFLLMGIR